MKVSCVSLYMTPLPTDPNSEHLSLLFAFFVSSVAAADPAFFLRIILGLLERSHLKALLLSQLAVRMSALHGDFSYHCYKQSCDLSLDISYQILPNHAIAHF